MANKTGIKIKGLLVLFIMLITILTSFDAYADGVESNRKERNFIRKGNSLYEQKRYAETEVECKKALEANPNSELATYNLALSLLNQSNASNAKDDNNPTKQASQMLSNLAATTSDPILASKSYYNLGNIHFQQEQYDQSIEMYKNCLRRNPNDDNARENLRLAQKKRQQQEQQQNNQQEQQDKQEQQQDKQNKDQDQQQQDNKEQDNKEQEQQQNQQNTQQNSQQGMSQENIEQILKAMQNAEQNTQQRVKEENAKEEKVRVQTEKNW